MPNTNEVEKIIIEDCNEETEVVIENDEGDRTECGSVYYDLTHNQLVFQLD